MTADKRTVSSEIREFFAEIQDGFREWRMRAGAQRTERHTTQPAQEIPPELNEITFTPLDPEADVAGASGAGKGVKATLLPGSICPVTRQALNPKGKIYQCRQCGIYYSPEGWEFLQQTAKGQCCGCRSVQTILPVVRAQ